MRGRSATITRNRNRSVSFSARLALVLNQPVGPSLESLPTELLLEILQLASAAPRYTSSANTHTLRSSYPDDGDDSFSKYSPRLDYRTLRALALTSRSLARLAHAIMYGSVELDQLKHTTLFARTVVGCAHRDITLTSTTSPVSPVRPTSSAFPYVPTLFAGKFTNRLILEYPFVDHPRLPRNRGAELERFHAATGAVLGVGQSTPSVASPVLASLRTLVVDTRVLEHHLKRAPLTSGLLGVSPTPSELILRSYIQRSAQPSSPSPLAPLASRLTHLTVACPSAKWTLPSTTLAALGGVPALTHLALVRKAHANEDNDAEFVQDVANILAERGVSLVRLVLVVIPDSGFETWKYVHEAELSDSNSISSSSDDDDSDDPGPDLRILEAYLSTTYIWTQLVALARNMPFWERRYPSVCIVPGMGDAWSRALRKSRKSGAIFESNIFHDQSAAGRDLWTWARTYETRRRARERVVSLSDS